MDERDQAALVALKEFLASRQGTINEIEDSEFNGLLKQTNVKLGVNAKKLAEEYALRLRLEAESKLAGKEGVQEKLSFVKMEYFLYALADADRLLGETRQLARHEEDLKREIATAKQAFDVVKTRHNVTGGYQE